MSTTPHGRPGADFSLLTGGPFYRALVRARLMRPDLTRAWRVAALLAAVTWLPMLVLAAIEGNAWSELEEVPFLFDFAAYARFLIAIPLLVTAERLTEVHVALCVRQFVEGGLVRRVHYPEFDGILRRVAALRSSWVAEGVMLVAVFAGSSMLRLDAQVAADGWRVVDADTGTARSVAGWWDLLVGTPIFQFILLRFLWRYLIWCWLMWRLSRMDLRLYATHPDYAGGLNFLGVAQRSYNRVVFAFAVILAAIGGQDLHAETASLEDYRFVLLGWLLLVVTVFVGPLYVFCDKLLAVRTKGVLEYGGLAHELAWLFHEKWIKRKPSTTEPILGSADVSSLADLGGSFQVVRSMRVVPAADIRVNVIPLLIAALVPFAPWVLMVVPVDEVLAFLLGFI
ncbi:MAG: hypothetical protein ACFCVH_05220 [Alphaproteobacteria bacterium]